MRSIVIWIVQILIIWFFIVAFFATGLHIMTWISDYRRSIAERDKQYKNFELYWHFKGEQLLSNSGITTQEALDNAERFLEALPAYDPETHILKPDEATRKQILTEEGVNEFPDAIVSLDTVLKRQDQ